MIAVRNGGRERRRARLVGFGARVPDRIVTNDEAVSDLGVIAAQRILDDAGIAPEEVDTLIVPTASPDHLFPSPAALVAERIGAHRAAAFDLNAGCTGFVYALAQACALVEAGIGRNVLIVGAEALSRLTGHTDRSTCILFGDAAAGALGGGLTWGSTIVRYEPR